jgi:transposase-like protein
MLARGVAVTCETIRSWCAKFGPDYAARLPRRRPRPGDKWHLDEVFVTINDTTHYRWRAVDQHGTVLDILVHSRRNAVAAKRFFRKLRTGLRSVPRVIVTNKLASYHVAHRELAPSVTHRRSKYLNNRAENSHQPTRVRERVPHNLCPPFRINRTTGNPSNITEADGLMKVIRGEGVSHPLWAFKTLRDISLPAVLTANNHFPWEPVPPPPGSARGGKRMRRGHGTARSRADDGVGGDGRTIGVFERDGAVHEVD